jgi:hypothetical protein
MGDFSRVAYSFDELLADRGATTLL